MKINAAREFALQHIIPTNIPDISKAYLGEEQIKKLTGDGGHVVIKVARGGKQYSVFMLIAQDDLYRLKAIYGPFDCME